MAQECGFSRRGGSCNINEDDLLKIGAALTQQGITVVKLLSNGGFGQVVRVRQRGIEYVIKISLDSSSDTQQGRKDCSVHRELDTITLLQEELRHLTVFDHQVIPQLKHCFHESRDTGAMIVVSLGSEKFAAILAMDQCYGDCRHVKDRLQKEAQEQGAISSDGRLFISIISRIIAILHDKGFAHRDLKWGNFLLMREWTMGTDPMIRLTDMGISVMDVPNREYVQKAFQAESSHKVTSARAKKILDSVQKNKKVFQVVTKASISKIMHSNGETLNIMNLLSGGSPGYRPEPWPESSQKKRKFQDSYLSTIQIAQAHDVHSIGAMTIEICHDKYQRPYDQQKCPSSAWEREIHNLNSVTSISEFMQRHMKIKSRQHELLQLQSQLVHSMIKKNPLERYSAHQVAKHDFLTRVFLSPVLQTLADSASGIPVPGGSIPWTARGKQYKNVQLKPLKICYTKHGLGVKCCVRYIEHELVTFYAGRTLLDGLYTFSKHVYPIETFHRYCDGFYGSGAWPVDRIAREMSVGAVINSSREDSVVRVHSQSNCYVQWAHAFWDDDGVLRIPIRARKALEEDEELFYSYDFDALHMGTRRG